MRLLLKVIALLALFTLSVSAQSTITGTTLIPSGGSGSRIRVCFTLEPSTFKPNVPRVAGAGTIVATNQWCVTPTAATGVWTTALYLNSEIEAGSVTGNTRWRVDWLYDGRQTSSALYNITTGGSLDSMTPVSSLPTATSATASAQKHVQTFSSSTTWTVTHNFNDSNPLCMWFDSNGQFIVPDTWDKDTSLTVATATFSIAQAGSVVCYNAANFTFSTATINNPIVGTPSANQAITGAYSLTFDSAIVGNINGVRHVDGVKYAQTVAGIQSAIDSFGATGGVVRLPCEVTIALGSTTLNLKTGIILEGCGPESSVLTWASTSGTAIDSTSDTRVAVKSLRISSTVAGASSIGIRFANCTECLIEDVFATGTTSSLGFYNPYKVTGIGSAAASVSNKVWLVRTRTDYHRGIALLAEHTVDLHIIHPSFYSLADNTTFYGIIIDTGVSGVYFTKALTGSGIAGLVVRHSDPGSFGGNAPRFLRGDVWADTTTGGDGVVFDSTLSTNFLASDLWIWSSFAGRNGAGTVVTAASDGLRVSGGQGLRLAGIFRGNTGNGILFNDADVARVQVSNCWILANNQDNNADQHGVYVTAATTNVSIHDCTIGNVLDATGHQKYAVKVSAVSADQFSIEDNDLNTNDTGPFSNANIGSYWVWGNRPTSSATANVVHGDILLASPAAFKVSAAAQDICETGTRCDFFGAATDTNTAIVNTSITVGAGTALKKVLMGTFTIDFAAPGANTIVDSSAQTLTGVADDSTWTCAVSPANAVMATSGSFSVWVSGADAVKVRYHADAGNANPASGAFQVTCFKQ